MLRSLHLTLSFLIIATTSFAQNADSLASGKQRKFYVEVLAGVDFLNYKNRKDDGTKVNPSATESVLIPFQNFNGNYFKRPPTLKLALNYRIHQYIGLYAGVKYDYFVTRLHYGGNRSNYSMARPQSEDIEYDVKSETHNLQAFAGLKFNFKGLYFAPALDLNTLIMKETKSGYYDNSLLPKPVVGYTLLDGTSSGVMQSCMGFSINIGYDFHIGKKGQAIKLELEGDYIYRNVNIPYTGSYALKILNPSVCIGYRF